MYCMECGISLSDEAKFCGSCGKQAINFNYERINPSGESLVSSDAGLSRWAEISKQYNIYVELSNSKSPHAQAAIRRFFEMLWGDKIVRILTYTMLGIIGSMLLISGLSIMSGSKSNSSHYSDSAPRSGKTEIPKAEKPVVSEDAIITSKREPAKGDICTKINGISQGYAEAVANKYQTSAYNIRFQRVNQSSPTGSCTIVVDTPTGVKNCLSGDILLRGREYLVLGDIQLLESGRFASLMGLGLCD